ncbi:ERI1 exoribonuclease 3 [Aplysia californica]|uniref:ERI1 exoribonuclease 3 n=1 Tax=Aplysia californica TaxID=6500 RepID=A0ABM0JPD1_APLCA|nr:ERI1 exoribonuclease 3 [Aplysia californica]
MSLSPWAVTTVRYSCSCLSALRPVRLLPCEIQESKNKLLSKSKSWLSLHQTFLYSVLNHRHTHSLHSQNCGAQTTWSSNGITLHVKSDFVVSGSSENFYGLNLNHSKNSKVKLGLFGLGFDGNRSKRQFHTDSNSKGSKVDAVKGKTLWRRMAAANVYGRESKDRNSPAQIQIYDYLLILDFEATCDNKHQPRPQEVIEFPVLKLNTKTLQVESTFHQYVLPQYHPQLTSFCTELTGIIQDMVNDQPHLPEVLQSFHKWMVSEGLLEPGVKRAFVTCGDWDLKTMLPKQCAALDLAPRPYLRSWINIKKSYADMTGTFPKGMMFMLDRLNLKHEGRHHSGIDDCRNIANIAVEMVKKGYIFKENGHLPQF